MIRRCADFYLTSKTEGAQAVEKVATEFTSLVFRILHYGNSQCFRVVQNPENHRNESGGGEMTARKRPVVRMDSSSFPLPTAILAALSMTRQELHSLPL